MQELFNKYGDMLYLKFNNTNKEIEKVLNEIVEAIEFTHEYENKENWEYQAKRALDLLNDNHYRWDRLPPKQKVSESHALYDRIFKTTPTPEFFTDYVSKEIWDLPDDPENEDAVPLEYYGTTDDYIKTTPTKTSDTPGLLDDLGGIGDCMTQ